MHTLLDLQGHIPTFIYTSFDKLHEVNVLNLLLPKVGNFYITNRDLTDFTCWNVLHQEQAFFVIQGKSNLLFRRLYSRALEKSTGLHCDQSIMLTATKASKDYPK